MPLGMPHVVMHNIHVTCIYKINANMKHLENPYIEYI